MKMKNTVSRNYGTVNNFQNPIRLYAQEAEKDLHNNAFLKLLEHQGETMCRKI